MLARGPLPGFLAHDAFIFMWLFSPWALVKLKTGAGNFAPGSLSGDDWESVGPGSCVVDR